ncbi:MAG: hypothetical protein OXI29_11065 [bacterium]|nr:hypothetical protein [bacterium]
MVDMPPEVGAAIGPYYVYALIDPRDDKIFYIGKGTGQRLLAHGWEAHMAADGQRQSPKIERIKEICKAGLKPQIDVMRHGINDEDDAFMVEAVLIDCLGIDNLTNKPRGHGTEWGRRTLNELVSQFGARPVSESAPPAVLFLLKNWQDEEMEIEQGYFRSGYGYRDGMTDAEMGDSVRAWWEISPESVKTRRAEYAVAVHDGITRGLFKIGRKWIRRDDGRRAFDVEPMTSGKAFDSWVGPLGRRINVRSYGSSFLYYP